MFGRTLMAKMIRIGFHDCVGGCDGCLNVDNDSNAGLSGIVATLEDLYTDEVLSPLPFCHYLIRC